MTGGSIFQGKGMGQSSHAAGGGDHGDRFLRRKPELMDISGAMITQKTIKGILEAGHISFIYQNLGDMGPADLAASGDGGTSSMVMSTPNFCSLAIINGLRSDRACFRMVAVVRPTRGGDDQ